MTAASVLRHPLQLLVQRLRNGKRAGRGGPSRSHHPVNAERETVWHDGEVYREIWDNDDDAIYDDLPTR